ncbi:MAG: nucleotidyltransferase domain-containing protein [Caldilineaceae bacterium]
METREKLKLRQQERTTLLNRAIALAQNDPRVRAAWLFGSGYRDDADAFSDIDLWMVVDDEHIDDIVTERHAYVTQIGQPLLTLDVPGNAPVGGGYLMLQYPGSHGPQQLDWYWQPRANAAIPDDARVLFDHSAMERKAGARSTDFSYLTQRILPPMPQEERSTAQKLLYELTFLWCMALIAAKDIARRDTEGAGWMLQYVAQMLTKARALLPMDDLPTWMMEPIEPTSLSSLDAMRHLRHLHQAAAALIPHLLAQGGQWPAQLVSEIDKFFALVEATRALDDPNGLVRRHRKG